MTTSCPNNVWNHTDGCACVANGSVTAECADLDLATAGPEAIALPAEYTPTATPVDDQTRHVHDLGDGKVVVTYASEEKYGDVTDPGEKMDAVRELLRDHSGASGVFPPGEASPQNVHEHVKGNGYGALVGIRFEDGKAVAESCGYGSEWGEFKENISRYDGIVVVDRDEMHRHTTHEGRTDYSQIENEINDYSGSTYTVIHDVVDTSTGKVLASDSDDYDGVLTTADDAAAQAESAHWDVEERLESFYDPDSDDDEFDDWGYGQDLED